MMAVRSTYRVASAWLAALFSCLALSSQMASPPAQTRSLEPLALAAVPSTKDCSSLRAADVSAAVGAKTVVETASTTADDQQDARCDIKVVVDDYARFEMHLPTKGWTQRLLFGGGPGAQTATGMKLDQFATVSWQDLGHRPDEDFFRNNYTVHVNAGYRGMHLQVLAAKALIAAFYGQGPRFSYYNACSNPGREGMIEAQRFPEDFDGIGAGCPPINTTVNNGLWHAWNVLTNMAPDGSAIITADKLPILHAAVLAQCDAADGLKDGIVSDPFACHPRLSAVECKPSASGASCLTPAQVHVAEELYRGPHDAQGEKLAPSGVLPGSELAWTATIVPSDAPFGGPKEAGPATERALRSHYSLPALDASWRLNQVRFDRATFDATTRLSYLHDGTNPDLSGFAKSGHKLILWQNLGDTNVLPTQAILYYEALRKQMGGAAVDGFVRFYTLPGVYHCGGGDGPVIANLLEPLMLWVERGIAPDALPGVHIPRKPGAFGQGAGNGAAAAAVPDLTRPLYPYPYIAKYIGTGSVQDAANFVRGPARPAPATLSDWMGSAFYKAGYMRWCTATASGLDCRTTH